MDRIRQSVVAYAHRNGHVETLAASGYAERTRIRSRRLILRRFERYPNGLISAVISFLRTLFFQVVSVFVLPIFFGVDGIWVAVAVAEMLSLTVTLTFFVVYRKKYRYA